MKRFLLILVSSLSIFSLGFSQIPFPNPDIRQTQILTTDLIIDSNETYVIEYTHLKIDGLIRLGDNARLQIRQSIIEHLGDPGSGQGLFLHDSSSLLADTVIFGGIDLSQNIDPAQVETLKAGDIISSDNTNIEMNNCFSMLQTFLGNSTVTIRNSYLWKEPLGLVHVEGNAKAVFEDSFIGAIFLGLPTQTPISIDSLVPGYFEYWSVKEDISDQFTYDIILRRTEVMENKKGYKGGMEIGWNLAVDALETNLTISNSKLNKFIIDFPVSEPAFLSDLKIGQPINFNLNNIQVTNTEVQTQWGVFMNGGPAEIINSEGLFIFMTGGDAPIIVHQSDVGEIDPRNYTGTLIFENSTWHSGYEIFENSHIKIEGSVRMLPTVPIFDETSSMTRSYDVTILNDLTQEPFANLDLKLLKGNEVEWQGTTDTDGNISFDISFDKQNYDHEWILTTDAPNIDMKKRITIFISNPVVVNLGLQQDTLPYRPVMHVAPGTPFFPLGTRINPYPAIQEAMDNMVTGIVYVHPGNYQGVLAPGADRGVIDLHDSIRVLGAGAGLTHLQGSVNAESVNGAQLSGIHIEDGIHSIASSLLLTNLLVHDFDGTAIWCTRSSLHLINNTIANNTQDGMFLHDSSTATLKNNIITGNAGFGIHGVESAQATIDYNNFWNNGEDYHEFFGAGEHDQSIDPEFQDVAGGDFRLQSSSPSIDAGDPSDQFNDLDGSRNDQGAFGGQYSRNIITDVSAPTSTNRALMNVRVYPNPSSNLLHLEVQIGESRWVTAILYDSDGREVQTLFKGNLPEGLHTHSFLINDKIYPGIYWVKVTAKFQEKIVKVILQ